MRSHTDKLLIFLINTLLAAVGIFIIKGKDLEKKSQKLESQVVIEPIDPSLVATQQKIASDRENKLRDINTSPKQAYSKQVTTETKTATTPKSSSSSSGGSSSTTKAS